MLTGGSCCKAETSFSYSSLIFLVARAAWVCCMKENRFWAASGGMSRTCIFSEPRITSLNFSFSSGVRDLHLSETR